MYKIDKQFHSLREGELQNLSPEIFFFFNLLFLIDASLFDFDFSIHSSSCLFKNIYHRSKQVGSKSELIYLYSLISSSCLFKNIYHRSKQAFLFITRRPPCGTWCLRWSWQGGHSITGRPTISTPSFLPSFEPGVVVEQQRL